MVSVVYGFKRGSKMYTVHTRSVPGAHGYNDVEFSLKRLGSRQKFKSAVSPNPNVTLGLLLVMNKEEISREGEELRLVLDVAASLDVPGLTAIGEGIRNRLEWTTRLLPETDWTFPEGFFEPISEKVYVQRVTTSSLIEESLQQAAKGYSRKILQAIQAREIAMQLRASQKRT